MSTHAQKFEDKLKKSFTRVGSDTGYYYTLVFGKNDEYEIRVLSLKDKVYSLGVYRNDDPETVEVLVDLGDDLV